MYIIIAFDANVIMDFNTDGIRIYNTVGYCFVPFRAVYSKKVICDYTIGYCARPMAMIDSIEVIADTTIGNIHSRIRDSITAVMLDNTIADIMAF